MAIDSAAVGPSAAGVAENGVGPTLTWAHTVEPGQNVLYAAVVFGLASADATATTTATYAGQTMQSIRKVKADGTFNNGYIEVFELVNPPVGTADEVAVGTTTDSAAQQSLVCGSVSHGGVDLTVPRTVATAFGDSAALSATIASGTGHKVLGFACCGSGISASTGTTLVSNNNNTRSGAGNLRIAEWDGAASVDAAFTAASDFWAVVTVDLTPSSGAPAPNTGSASGTTIWSGNATGSTEHRGDAAGVTAWSGSAGGSTTRSGSASGTTTWSGSAGGRSGSAPIRNISITVTGPYGGWDVADPSGGWDASTADVAGWSVDAPAGGWSAGPIYE